MTADETRLLESCLNALDRRFDRQSSAGDVWAVLSAASQTLRAIVRRHQLDGAVAVLLPAVRSGASAEVQRERALEVTGDPRHYLAGLPETA